MQENDWLWGLEKQVGNSVTNSFILWMLFSNELCKCTSPGSINKDKKCIYGKKSECGLSSILKI
jgi:hypothetical protein